MSERSVLTSVDWIQAAFRALTANGPQGIKVEAIARSLKVSKGSFYWHFKDANALKQAMLLHWQEVAVEGIIKEVESSGDKPIDQIRTLIEIAVSDLDEPYGGHLVEAAIRDWARYNEDASKALKQVDSKRLSFLRRLFRALGAPRTIAAMNASTLYAAIIGLEQLSWKMRVNRKRSLNCLLDMMLATAKKSGSR